MPSYDPGRDLIANRVAENGAMSSATAHLCADTPKDFPRELLSVQKSDVLLPGEARHHSEALPLRGVEQPARRNIVRPDGVDSTLGDTGEVSLDHFSPRERASICVRSERPVSHTANIEFLVTHKEELAFHAGADVCFNAC
jgi:hypothetical protein